MCHFEHPVNWRLARLGFYHPTTRISFHSSVELPPNQLTLFLPQNRTIDVISLRNWLHDNIDGGYQMSGCYEGDTSDRATFTGLKLAFTTVIDAVFFRLSWVSAVVLQITNT